MIRKSCFMPLIIHLPMEIPFLLVSYPPFITRLWITDSDDLLTEPKEQLLNEYSVSMSSAGTIELKGNTRYQLWVVGLQPMSGYML